MFTILPELLTHPYFIQGLGFLAFFVALYAFTRTNDSRLRAGQAGQAIILALHFYLLGAGSAAAMAFLIGVRNLVSLFINVRLAALPFFAIYIIVGFFTYQSAVDVLPVLAALLGTTAVFYLSGIAMRLVLMSATSLWVAHNFIYASLGPFLMELVILLATAHATYRLWQLRSDGTPTTSLGKDSSN